MTAQVRVLPIHLEPEPGEPLDSWLEAHAHRCGVDLAAHLRAIGLQAWPTGRRAPIHTVALSAAEAHAISRATGVEARALHAMTLRRYDGHAITVQSGRHVNRMQLWGNARGSRYCPACLREREGRWLLRWRLPWSFACTRHALVLAHTCPACQRPTRSHAMFSARPAPGLCPAVIERGGPACAADLATAPVIALTPGSAVLDAQHYIDRLLDRTEHADAHDPHLRTAFEDLRALAAWTLSRCEPGEFADLGIPSDAFAPYRPESFNHAPPTPLMAAAGLTRATRLIQHPDTPGSEQFVRSLLERDRHRRTIMPPSEIRDRWAQASIPVQQLIWRAMDPLLGTIDRLRYRTPTRAPHPPTTASTAALAERARKIPQQFWPGLSCPLIAPQRSGTGPALRRAISLALLLPGLDDRRTTMLPAMLGHHRCTTALPARLLEITARGEHDIITLIARLAEHLEAEPCPIDYQRRREAVGADLLPEDVWHAITRTPADPDAVIGPSAHATARRYLYQRLTGNELLHAPRALRPNTSAQAANAANFPLRLTASLRQTLDEYAEHYLRAKNIYEPVVWEPPADLATGLNLPGRAQQDIDLAHAHRLLSDAAPPTHVAAALGTSIEHLRAAFDHQPPASRPIPPRPAPRRIVNTWATAQTLDPHALREAYLEQRKTIKQIAAANATSATVIGAALAQHGIEQPAPVRSRITEAWLREQYLDLARTFPEIAAELGVSRHYIAMLAREYGISARPKGGASTAQAFKPAPADCPDILRPALTGTSAWNRLRRFQSAMNHRTIPEAAQALGIHRAVLERQIRRLETDLNTTLYHRPSSGGRLRPTPAGHAVLNALTAYPTPVSGPLPNHATRPTSAENPPYQRDKTPPERNHQK